MQLTGAVRPELKLSLQLSETWDDHHPAGKGTVRLVSTMFGAWKPTAACPTPRLWILLCGHYRTFSWARSSLAEVANLSSADCYFIFAAIPLQIESVARTGSWSPVAGTLWQRKEHRWCASSARRVDARLQRQDGGCGSQPHRRARQKTGSRQGCVVACSMGTRQGVRPATQLGRHRPVYCRGSNTARCGAASTLCHRSVSAIRPLGPIRPAPDAQPGYTRG